VEGWNEKWVLFYGWAESASDIFGWAETPESLVTTANDILKRCDATKVEYRVLSKKFSKNVTADLAGKKGELLKIKDKADSKIDWMAMIHPTVRAIFDAMLDETPASHVREKVAVAKAAGEEPKKKKSKRS